MDGTAAGDGADAIISEPGGDGAAPDAAVGARTAVADLPREPVGPGAQAGARTIDRGAIGTPPLPPESSVPKPKADPSSPRTSVVMDAEPGVFGMDGLSASVPAPKSARARRWSRLESVSISNFKAIASTTVALGDVTILVGPNGCGKSSVLQAIHWAARAASYIVPKNSKEMMSFDRIDYLPSSEPLKTAHRGDLRSDTASSPTRVVFNHAPASDEDAAASVTVKIFALPPSLSRIGESLESRRSRRVERAERREKDGARRRPYAAQPILCVIHAGMQATDPSGCGMTTRLAPR